MTWAYDDLSWFLSFSAVHFFFYAHFNVSRRSRHSISYYASKERLATICPRVRTRRAFVRSRKNQRIYVAKHVCIISACFWFSFSRNGHQWHAYTREKNPRTKHFDEVRIKRESREKMLKKNSKILQHFLWNFGVYFTISKMRTEIENR